MDYLNFDLTIKRSGESYRLYVLSAPLEATSSHFDWVRFDVDLTKLLQGHSFSLRETRGHESEAAKAFGKVLFDSIFTGNIRGYLRASIHEANKQGKGLRISLRLADVPELADIPWEYLYDHERGQFLATSRDMSLVRFLELPAPTRPHKLVRPLRMLVVISSPEDYYRVDVAQEWAGLNFALGNLMRSGLLELELLKRPSLTGMRPRLRQQDFNIFHFVGHGDLEREGALVFEDESRLGRIVLGSDLAVALETPAMRLVVLNLHQERIPTLYVPPVDSLARRLAGEGVPAVIASPFKINDRAGMTFARTFYTMVAYGAPVDLALARARAEVFALAGGLEQGTPTLYMSSADGRIFDVEPITYSEGPEGNIDIVSRIDSVEIGGTIIGLDLGGGQDTRDTNIARRQSKPRFFFELIGSRARHYIVECGCQVSLIFNYGLPDRNALATLRGKHLPKEDTDLGISVSAKGFTFLNDAWYQVARFRSGRLEEPIEFILRAADEVREDAGLYITFDVRGYVLYQFNLAVKLVTDISPYLDATSDRMPLDLDLDTILYETEQAVKALR